VLIDAALNGAPPVQRYLEAMVLLPEGVTTENVRPLRRAEYDRLVGAGTFDGKKVELIDGRSPTSRSSRLATTSTTTPNGLCSSSSR
jgi:hypothetical protein